MSEPRTIREVNIAAAGVEGRLGLLIKLGGAIVAILLAVLGGIATLYVQIGSAKDDIAAVKVDVAAVKSTVAAIGKQMDKVDSSVASSRDQILARIQPSPTPQGPQPQQIAGGFYVTDSVARALHELLKVPPFDPRKGSMFGMWDKLPEKESQPLPQDFAAKLGLKGFRFAVDPNTNAIALIEPTQNVIVALI
jgi:hypothetical protein